MQVANLSADLTANTSRFESGFKRANQIVNSSTSGWARSLTQADSKFNAMGGTLAMVTGRFNMLYTALAAIATGGALGAITNASLKAADSLKDMSDRLQISTDTLQAYQYAAMQSGLETGTLETALTKLQAKIADGEVKYTSTAQGFDAIAEAVRNAKDDMERARIVNENFGDKLGAKLLPMLSGGSEGLRDFADEAQRTGNIINGDVILAAARFNDKMEALGATIKNNFQAGFLNTLVTESGDLRDIYTDPDFAQGMQRIGELHGELAAYMATVLINANKLISAYGDLNQSVADYIDKQARATFEPIGKKYDNWITKVTGRPRRGAEMFGPPLPGDMPADPFGGNAPIPGTKPPLPSEPYSNPSTVKAGASAADKYKDVLESLRQETDELRAQTTLYGQKQSAVDRAVQQVRIENQLRVAGVKLTKQQQEELGIYLDQIEVQNELVAQQAEQQKKLEQAERDRQQAIKQFSGDVVDSLQEAIDSGGELSDIVKKLALDFIKLAINSQQFKNIFESTTMGSGGGSGGGGLLGSIIGGIGNMFGGFFGGSAATFSSGGIPIPPVKPPIPSHASGIDMVARDTYAKIHKGEAVLNTQDAQLWRSGGDGDMNVTIHAEGAEAGVENKIRNVMNEVITLRKQMPGIALGAVKDANRRDPRFIG